jgi:hypothetical protein
MEPSSPGDRVRVDIGGTISDGLVFDTPSRTKIVVAVLDASRGPVFRTVAASAITERSTDSPHDHVLELLIRRTPPPVRAADRAGAGPGQRRAGHSRGSMHRTTGK